jgi:alpha-N-arabinofuranosidase
MRLVDPTIELVACGSSGSGMPTFGAWEQTVLRHAYDQVDYVSLHAYYQEHEGDHGSFLASAVDMDAFIESVVSTADAVRAGGKHTKRINLSFDEWNVWYVTGRDTPDQPHVIEREGVWREHPRIIEDEYNVTDAVVVGTLLNSLLRHGDRVKIANLAQLVNVIAPIRTEAQGPAWRQSTFWPFARMAALAQGVVLRTQVRSDRYDSARFDAVDLVDVAATWDEEHGRVALFLAHRGLDEDAEVEVALRGWTTGRVVRAEVLTDGDRHASNTVDQPDRVGLVPLDGVHADAGTVTLRLPPLSWAVVEVEVTRA